MDAHHMDSAAASTAPGMPWHLYAVRHGEGWQAMLSMEPPVAAGNLQTFERGLLSLGVDQARLNLRRQELRIVWRGTAADLSRFVARLEDDGYAPRPLMPDPQRGRSTQRQWALARLGLAGFVAGNVMMFSVGLYAGHFYGIEPEFKHLLQWISGVLAVPAVVFGGWPFWHGAWRGLAQGRFGMDGLVSAAILIVMTYSTIVLLSGQGETYFDSVTMFIFFLLIGRSATLFSSERTGHLVGRLMRFMGQHALRLEAGGPVAVSVEAIQPGDTVIVSAGMAIPADGQVIAGEAAVDEQTMSGESEPRPRGTGDRVLAGTVVRRGTLTVLAECTGTETMLAKVARYATDALAERGPIQTLADRVAGYFGIGVLSVAAFTVAGWSVWGGAAAAPWVIGISVVVIACPCALGLATPLALLSGAGRAGQAGVLIRRSGALERAAQVTDVVLDKTGTLTTGQPSVLAVHALADGDGWLGDAAALEAQTRHPLAHGVLACWRQRSGTGQALPTADNVLVEGGAGVSGTVEGRPVVVGRRSWLEAAGIDMSGVAAGLPDDGYTELWVAVAGRPRGRLALADPLRPGMHQLIADLRGAGLRLHLLSGDRPAVVEAIATELGIAQWRAGLLPEEKAHSIRELQAQGAVVAMVGDGINDAPALAQADVGCTVARANDFSLQVADVILVRDGPGGLVALRAISDTTRRLVRDNILISLAFNAVAIPLAVAGHVIPLAAAVTMSASSLAVVLHALRGRR